MGYTPQVFSLHASGVAGMLDGVGGIMDLLWSSGLSHTLLLERNLSTVVFTFVLVGSWEVVIGFQETKSTNLVLLALRECLFPLQNRVSHTKSCWRNYIR
jgi:hypothetical protein